LPIQVKSKIAFRLFWLALLVGILINYGGVIVDTYRRYQVTESIWQNVPPVSEIDIADKRVIVGANNSVHYWYGMGQSIFMLPADIVSTNLLNLFGVKEQLFVPEASTIKSTLVLMLTFPLFTAATVAFAFLLLFELGFSLRQSTVGALALLFGTTLLIYTKLHQENNQIIFFTITAYYYLLLWLKHNKPLYLLLGSGLVGSLL
jgi:hypothetical protein